MTQQIKQKDEGMFPRSPQIPEHFNLSVFLPEPTDPPKERKCPIEIL